MMNDDDSGCDDDDGSGDSVMDEDIYPIKMLGHCTVTTWQGHGTNRTVTTSTALLLADDYDDDGSGDNEVNNCL